MPTPTTVTKLTITEYDYVVSGRVQFDGKDPYLFEQVGQGRIIVRTIWGKRVTLGARRMLALADALAAYARNGEPATPTPTPTPTPAPIPAFGLLQPCTTIATTTPDVPLRGHADCRAPGRLPFPANDNLQQGWYVDFSGEDMDGNPRFLQRGPFATYTEAEEFADGTCCDFGIETIILHLRDEQGNLVYHVGF